MIWINYERLSGNVFFSPWKSCAGNRAPRGIGAALAHALTAAGAYTVGLGRYNELSSGFPVGADYRQLKGENE